MILVTDRLLAVHTDNSGSVGNWRETNSGIIKQCNAISTWQMFSSHYAAILLRQ